MENKKISKMKILQKILGLMMVGVFVFFILGEVLLPTENLQSKSTYEVFEPDWVHVKADGTETAITVPGECEAEQGEWVTIKTTLPDDQKSTWICVRSMQQDLKVYVGDELREEYSSLDTQPFGKTSTTKYIFFQVYESDAGEELRIEFMSDSPYTGYVHKMYCGEKFDIQQHLYKLFVPGLVMASLLFIVGLFVVIGSAFAKFFLKKDADLIHLGNAVVIAATWLIVESRLRQFVLPNSTIAMLTGFLLIAMLPYPILAYINSIQNHRYKKIYAIIGVCTAVNFVVIITLQVLNIMDFFETMTSSHLIILALILVMFITIIRDTVKGYVRDYREVAIGFVALMVAGVLEVGVTYIVSAQINGIALCIGLILLLIAAGLKTIRDMVNIEKEKQYAIATSESKAKFLANISHEIRTPINTVIGMNEMILRENQDENIEEYAYNIKSASHMLLSLINDVLDFSKMEAGKLQIVENAYSLANMLKDAILGIDIRAKQKNLDLKLDIDETMPAVLKGDEIRIKQILNNLLSNAVKYTQAGSVTFSAKGEHNEDGFTLILSVQDTGMGIKEEDMRKLFSSFERLELAKNRYIQGTGLGLNITKQLVDLMAGTIQVESEYGKGSTFTVKLKQEIVDEAPMGKIDQKHREIEQVESVKVKGAVTATEGMEAETKTSEGAGEKDAAKSQEGLYIPDAKILVVDDTKINQTVIKQLLKRTGAQLDTADGGNECLEKTKETKYDLILMDHMMPEPDGVETLHHIKSDESNINKDTPIVVLTANAIAGMKEQYLEEGFADYLSKPVEVNRLEEILVKFLV